MFLPGNAQRSGAGMQKIAAPGDGSAHFVQQHQESWTDP